MTESTITNANVSVALVTGTDFGGTGITKEQLYSTASYQSRNLQGIRLTGGHIWPRPNDLTGWDFTDQDLTNANLYLSTLTNANLSGANLANAFLANALGLDSTIADSNTVYNHWTQFPQDFNPVAAGITVRESPAGDFDGNDVLELSDVDLLIARIRQMGHFMGWLDEMVDVNGGGVNAEDLHVWVKDLRRTWFGDANLDGEFNSLDLVSLLQAGQYDDGIPWNSTWSTGDWNADGEFDRADLVLSLQDDGYGQGPRPGGGGAGASRSCPGFRRARVSRRCGTQTSGGRRPLNVVESQQEERPRQQGFEPCTVLGRLAQETVERRRKKAARRSKTGAVPSQ